MSISTRKKRVSKKAPKSWRKNVNIQDVEDFLEEQRTEERLGKKIVDKTNEELFHIDTKADAKLLLTKKEKRALLAKKPFRNLKALINTSKIEDPVGQRTHVKTRDEKQNAQCKRLKRLQGLIPKKEIMAQKHRVISKRKKKEILQLKKSKRIFQKDLWLVEEEKPIAEELKIHWIDENVAKHTMKNTRQLVICAPPQIRDKRNRIDPIEEPHPGVSYNPSFKDHQSLLNKVVEKEIGIIDHASHLNRVTTKQFTKMSAAERDAKDMREMSQGLPLDDDSNNETNTEDDLNEEENEFKSINGPVKNKKKDKKARRKQKEQKEIKKKLKNAKIEKRKVADIYQLKFLKKSVEKAEKHRQKLRQQKRKRLDEKKFETARIGRLKFVEPEIDVNLPENISGSLRTLKPEGQLLTDRFKSLQKRNLIAPNKHVGLVKRPKVKRFTKNTHKEKQVPLVRKKTKNEII